MQARSSIILSTDRFELDGLELVARRHPRARRCKLRYDGEHDRLLLTLPPRASLKRARDWAAGQRDWIEQQRAKRVAPIKLIPGTTIPFRGVTLALCHDPSARRTPQHHDDRLIIGGPIESFARRAERWLKAQAKGMLAEDVAEFSGAAGVDVEAMAVGNARTRWGSCSSSGTLRFNWRLICAPDEVRRYVAAHEVAHRRHMDHGRAFHALEEELFGGSVEAARRQLLALGPGLQRIGR